MTSQSAAALELLPALKSELGVESNAQEEYNLLKFLHWKTNVKRSAERLRGLNEWQSSNPFAFDNLKVTKDPQLKRVLESSVIVAPPGMVDKHNRRVLVGRLRNNDMTDGRTVQDVVRMAIYTVDRVLEDPLAQSNGVVVFHDMTGLGRNNVDIRIPKTLLGALIGHFPIRIHGIYMYNAPAFVRGMFSFVSFLMPKKLRDRTHFVSSLDDLYELIDREEMLQEHGGNRQYDALEWVKEQAERERAGIMQSLADRVEAK